MDKTKGSILEYRENAVIEIRKLFGLDKPERMEEAIDLLEQWVQKQSHFNKKDFSRDYLERIIISTKGSVEVAKTRLDKACTLRTLMPKYFEDANVKTDYTDIDYIVHAFLPKTTDDFYRVYMMKNSGKKYTQKEFFKLYTYMLKYCEYLKAFDYFQGIIVVLDLTEANLVEVVANINPTHLRSTLTMVTEGYGLRLKGLHILTTSKVIDTFVMVLKQAVSAKIGNRIMVHKNVESLYEYIPKDLLPVEYGGKECSLPKLQDQWKEMLSSPEFIEHMTEMKKACTNESFRPTDKFNDAYIGMPGTFRTLSLD